MLFHFICNLVLFFQCCLIIVCKSRFPLCGVISVLFFKDHYTSVKTAADQFHHESLRIVLKITGSKGSPGSCLIVPEILLIGNIWYRNGCVKAVLPIHFRIGSEDCIAHCHKFLVVAVIGKCSLTFDICVGNCGRSFLLRAGFITLSLNFDKHNSCQE